MYIHTKLLFKKRDDYVEVCVYYSRLGLKFRESTGVKILPKHITRSGDISAAHPYYTADVKRIGEIQDIIERLIADYVLQHQDKPPVRWLQSAYKAAMNNIVAPPTARQQQPHEPPLPPPAEAVPSVSPSLTRPASVLLAAPRPGGAMPVVPPSSIPHPPTWLPAPGEAAEPDDERDAGLKDDDIDENILLYPELAKQDRLQLPVLSCWRSFRAGKKKVYRGDGAMARMNNAKHSFKCYQAKRSVEVRFGSLGQLFFNDYVKFMAEEQEYYHNVKDLERTKVKPSIGLNNNTTIKRLTDLEVDPVIKRYGFLEYVAHTGLGEKELTAPYGSNLFRIILERPDIQKQISEIFDATGIDVHFDDNGPKISIPKKGGANTDLRFPSLSASLQRMCFYLAAIASNDEKLLVFDNLDAHIFPTMLIHLASGMFENFNNQYLFSTHHYYMLIDLLESGFDNVAISTSISKITRRRSIAFQITISIPSIIMASTRSLTTKLFDADNNHKKSCPTSMTSIAAVIFDLRSKQALPPKVYVMSSVVNKNLS